MSGFRALAARAVLLPALAVYFFCFTNIIPSLHSCFPIVDGKRGGKALADSASLPQETGAPASRERAERADSADESGSCVACLFSARLRGLSPPAGVTAPVLAQSQRLTLQSIQIPALSELWIQVLPRAPPAITST